MQFKFNLDAQFNSYKFFSFEFTCMHVNDVSCLLLHACTDSLFYLTGNMHANRRPKITFALAGIQNSTPFFG